jgi:hypothetical protein
MPSANLPSTIPLSHQASDTVSFGLIIVSPY